MLVKSYREPENQRTLISVALNDTEVFGLKFRDRVSAMVENRLAEEIVKKVMERLGPPIDAALASLGGADK